MCVCARAYIHPYYAWAYANKAVMNLVVVTNKYTVTVTVASRSS